MSEYASIQQLWKQHMNRPFPRGVGGEEVDGYCLVVLADSAAGIICGFFSGTRAPGLSAKRLQVLSECAASLSRIVPQLPDEHRVYFDTLREISERVVRYCRRGSYETHNVANHDT